METPKTEELISKTKELQDEGKIKQNKNRYEKPIVTIQIPMETRTGTGCFLESII